MSSRNEHDCLEVRDKGLVYLAYRDDFRGFSVKSTTPTLSDITKRIRPIFDIRKYTTRIDDIGRTAIILQRLLSNKRIDTSPIGSNTSIDRASFQPFGGGLEPESYGAELGQLIPQADNSYGYYNKLSYTLDIKLPFDLLQSLIQIALKVTTDALFGYAWDQCAESCRREDLMHPNKVEFSTYWKVLSTCSVKKESLDVGALELEELFDRCIHARHIIAHRKHPRLQLVIYLISDMAEVMHCLKNTYAAGSLSNLKSLLRDVEAGVRRQDQERSQQIKDRCDFVQSELERLTYNLEHAADPGFAFENLRNDIHHNPAGGDNRSRGAALSAYNEQRRKDASDLIELSDEHLALYAELMTIEDGGGQSSQEEVDDSLLSPLKDCLDDLEKPKQVQVPISYSDDT